jgi:hypothetical protein
MFEQAKPVPPRTIGLLGESGAGKTHTALRLASAMSAGGHIALIDVGERGSSGGYSPDIPHVMAEVQTSQHGYSIDSFLRAMSIAQKEYEVIVIDSLSNLWLSVLNYKEALDNSGKGNGYTNWGKAGKLWDKVLQSFKLSDISVVVCIRTKMAYVLELNKEGKQEPKKVGLQPIARDGVEYEFDVLCQIHNQSLTVLQPRGHANLRGLVLPEPTVEQLGVFRGC